MNITPAGVLLPDSYQMPGIVPAFRPGIEKPEEDYLEFSRLGEKLGLPCPQIHVRVAATNPDGSPGDIYEGRSRTYNRNFWNYVFGSLTMAPAGAATFAAGFLALKRTSGVIDATDFNVGLNNNAARSLVWGAAVGTVGTVQGIVVGTGVTAESFEHVALVTPIAHGNGAGQLSYTAQNATTAVYSAGPPKVWTATQSRIFNNNSGGTITVAETGFYGGGATQYWPGSISYLYMLCRDLLGASVGVLNSGQLTVTYTMTLTFPA